MRSTRCSARVLGVATLVSCSALARVADADPTVVQPAPYRTFAYAGDDVEEDRANYFRVVLEEISILGAGTIEYFQNRTANDDDWDLSFSADSFEKKVAGHAVAFDGNKFDTNWVLHPLGGWLYYGAARGNRLAPYESLLIATTASATWEFLGEFREQVSINDLMATPLGGASLVEPFLQLGTWFERGRPTFGRSLMATLLAPTKRVHDALDDLQPDRDVERGMLDARLAASGGVIAADRSNEIRSAATLGLRTHLLHGPDPYAPGHQQVWLSDGNLSTIRAEAAFTGDRLSDVRFATRVAFAGYFNKHVSSEEEKYARGNAMFLGIGTGIDYQWHAYERPGGHVVDRTALVELLGTTLENWVVSGSTKVHTQLALAFDFAGVTSLARDDRIRARGTAGLPTVLTQDGYAHAFGGTIAPQVEVVFPALTLAGEARLDVFRSIVERDRFHERYDATVAGADERFTAALKIERDVLPNLAVGVKAARLLRRSRIEEYSRSFGETSVRLEVTLKL